MIDEIQRRLKKKITDVCEEEDLTNGTKTVFRKLIE